MPGTGHALPLLALRKTLRYRHHGHSHFTTKTPNSHIQGESSRPVPEVFELPVKGLLEAEACLVFGLCIPSAPTAEGSILPTGS